jgi:glycosyltransferase involved in cell wall biosynthesis
MKVGLVTDTFSVEAGTGIARYSQEMLTGLPKLGLNVQSLCFPPLSLPFGTVIHHVVSMPYLISRQAGNFDLIHAASPICALCFPLIRKPKKIVTYHDLTSLLCRDTSSAFHTRLFAPLFLRIGKSADRIIADSSQTREEMIAHLSISGDKITVVNLGVDDVFTPMKKEPRDHRVIGYVGALSRRKRLNYLLKAFRLLKERHAETPVRLVICGSKRLEYPALVKLAAELDVSNDVEFRGPLC